MKRVLFVVGAVLAMGAVTAVSVAAVSRNNISLTTLRLVEKPVSFHFIDQPPDLGDRDYSVVRGLINAGNY